MQGHIDEVISSNSDKMCTANAMTAVAKSEVGILLDTAIGAALPINTLDDGPI